MTEAPAPVRLKSAPKVRAPKLKTSMLSVWFLVAIPTLLVLACAILILIFRTSAFDVLMGVLLVIICGALGAGAALTIVGLRADRKLAALQLDFVSKVSHELKTPLTSIRMFVDTLQLGRVREPEKVERCLNIISKETDRLSQLIGRLLSWGAMEAGAFTLMKEPISPRALVEKTLRMFEPQVEAAGAELVVSIKDDLPLINVDEQAMVDSLLNLLTNAVRYGGTPKKIWIDVTHSERHVEIAVRDNGIGIEFKHQHRIFERFYRADERYTRSSGGTGLGLAIARHVVVAHEGSIGVESRVGAGSTFTVRIPAHVEKPS